MARACGHPTPFSHSELAELTELRVLGSRRVSELRACPGLRRLEIVASDLVTLDELAGLDALVSLSVLGCPVESAAALAGHAALQDVRIDFTFLQDIAPLIQIPNLRRGRFVGNPIDEVGWRDLRVAWRRSRAEGSEKLRLLEFGPDDAWEATRSLWEHEVRLSFGVLDGTRPVLVRPGVPTMDDDEVESCPADPAALMIAAGRGDRTDAIFESNHHFATSHGFSGPIDFTGHRLLGDAVEALGWVRSSRTATRDLLVQFIESFPDQVFFRDLDVPAAGPGPTAEPMPPTLTSTRGILAGALPDQDARFHLSAFAGNSPRADSLPDIWFVPRDTAYASQERRRLLHERARLFPVAEWTETARSILAVSLDNGDPAIYEFGEEDLQDAVSEGRPIADSIHRVFSSYAELLSHIDGYTLRDGTRIAALARTTDREG
jgi:hypothetical protein